MSILKKNLQLLKKHEDTFLMLKKKESQFHHTNYNAWRYPLKGIVTPLTTVKPRKSLPQPFPPVVNHRVRDWPWRWARHFHGYTPRCTSKSLVLRSKKRTLMPHNSAFFSLNPRLRPESIKVAERTIPGEKKGKYLDNRGTRMGAMFRQTHTHASYPSSPIIDPLSSPRDGDAGSIIARQIVPEVRHALKDSEARK